MDKGMDGIWALADALGGGSAKQETRTQATVTRIAEDGTIWVHLPGGVPETPINGASTASVRPGDSVQVLVGDGRASLIGNATSPAVGDRQVTERIAPVAEKAEKASVAAVAARQVAESAEGIATSARAVANAVSQHFWTDDSGVHVTEATQEEWEQEQTGANVILNSVGMLFRRALNPLLALVTGENPGVAIYDGEGNDAENIVASFTGEGAQVGGDGSSNVRMDASGFAAFDRSGSKSFEVRMDGAVTPAVMDRSASTKTKLLKVQLPVYLPPSKGRHWWKLGTVSMDVSDLSSGLPIIDYSRGTMNCTRVEFDIGFKDFKPYGSFSPFAINGTYAKYGPVKIAPDEERKSGGASAAMYVNLGGAGLDGSVTSRVWCDFVTDEASFEKALCVEAKSTYDGTSIKVDASLFVSDELNEYIKEKGEESSGDGEVTPTVPPPTVILDNVSVVLDAHYDASAYAPSLTFGTSSGWRGDYSSAFGTDIIASGDQQTVLGRANVEDTENAYALIIGNGADADNRSNALTVDWLGNLWAVGKATLTGAIEAAKLLVTKDASDTSTNAIAVNDGTSDVLAVGWNGGVTAAGEIVVKGNSETATYRYSSYMPREVALATNSTNGATGTRYGGTIIRGANGQWVSAFEAIATAAGLIRAQMRAQNMTADGKLVTNDLLLGVAKDGTRTVSVSDAAVWRSAIGAASTTDLNVTTGTVTRGANASSIGSYALRKQGNVVNLIINDLKLSAACASGGNANTVATIPAGFRPAATARVLGCVTPAGNFGNVWVVVGTGGNVMVANRSSVSISTSHVIQFCITYIV